MRKFRSDPVEEEKVRTILRCATKAPNASNIQPWRFVVVRDPAVKQKLRDVAVKAQRQVTGYLRTAGKEGMYEEGRLLTESLPSVPVLIFVFVDPLPFIEETSGGARLAIKLRIPQAWRQVNLNLSASVYPAVQNLLLAAKGLGLGTCMTTSITLREQEVKRILKVPNRMRLLSLVYVGYPSTRISPPSRRPFEDCTYNDEWGRRA